MKTKTPYDIVKRPLMTEKSTKSREKYNTYIFEVDINSNKPEIKKAIEAIFQVKISEIKTMIMSGKPKRTKFQVSHRSNWKKALVTIKEGRIDIL